MFGFLYIMVYFFEETILYNSTLSNFKSSNVVIKKTNVFKKILLTISVTTNFTFKTGNSKLVENIFSEKLNHHL